MSGNCCYCLKPFYDPKALRPYGPGGALTCAPCANSTPERRATAERRIIDAFEKAKSVP